MPVPLMAIAAGAGIAKSGFDFFSANSAEKQAKKELAALQKPFYKIQDEFYRNQNLATEQAQSGLSANAINYYTSQAERGLGSGISAIQQTGGNPNDITKLFDSYNQGIFNTAVQDSMLQGQKIQQLMATNRELAGQKTMKWAIDDYQPYQNKLKELTQRRAAAQINKNNALNSIISGSLSVAGSMQNQPNMKVNSTPDPSSYLNVDVTRNAPSWLNDFQDPNLTANG